LASVLLGAYPLPSKRDCSAPSAKSPTLEPCDFIYLSLLALRRTFDTIATFDHVSLETDRSRAAVQLEEEAAGVAENRADLIPPPQRCCRSLAVLAYGL